MICILHGWLLEGSGSNLWTRSIITALAKRGETVHLVCQENHPEKYDAVAEAWRLRHTGSIEKTLERKPMFSSIEADGVRWADGTFQKADAILWSTGFRPELRHLAPLRLREKAGGVTVGQGSSWKDPRIFFAGYGPQASTIGANRAGRQIARHVVAQLSNL